MAEPELASGAALLAELMASSARANRAETKEARLARLSRDPLELFSALSWAPPPGEPPGAAGAQARIQAVIAGMLDSVPSAAKPREHPAIEPKGETSSVIEVQANHSMRQHLKTLLLVLSITILLAIWLLS